MKVCTKCHQKKENSEFHKRSDNGKLYNLCKACWYERDKKYQESHREQRISIDLKYKYGMTLEQKNHMVIEQQGLCGACEDPLGIDPLNICVDHDHKTGKVRKVICRGCNTALGSMKENPEKLRKLAKYAEYCKDN